MKKFLKETLLRAAAKTALETAKKTSGAASGWEMYQPKEPEALKKLKK